MAVTAKLIVFPTGTLEASPVAAHRRCRARFHRFSDGRSAGHRRRGGADPASGGWFVRARFLRLVYSTSETVLSGFRNKPIRKKSSRCGHLFGFRQPVIFLRIGRPIEEHGQLTSGDLVVKKRCRAEADALTGFESGHEQIEIRENRTGVIGQGYSPAANQFCQAASVSSCSNSARNRLSILSKGPNLAT